MLPTVTVKFPESPTGVCTRARHLVKMENVHHFDSLNKKHFDLTSSSRCD